MNITRIIGIDAGLTGGIAILKRESIESRVWTAQACPMPVRFVQGPPRRGAPRKKYHDYEIAAIHYMLRGIMSAAASAGGETRVCLEKVTAMPSRPDPNNPAKFFRGSIGTAKLMMGYGILMGIVRCTFPEKWLIEVHQSSWQAKVLGALSSRNGMGTKESAINCCRILYPEVSLLATPKSRTDHEGMADALMIAEFARRKLYEEEG